MHISELSERLPELVGKKIKRVLYLMPRFHHLCHLFFEFEDGSSYEIWGNCTFGFTGMMPKGWHDLDHKFQSDKDGGSNMLAVMTDGKSVQYSDENDPLINI